MRSLRNNGSIIRLIDFLKRYFFVLLGFCLLNIQMQFKSQRIFFWVVFIIVSIITFILTLPYVFIQLRTSKNTKTVRKLEKQGFEKLKDLPIYYKNVTNSLLEDVCKKVYLSHKEEQRKLFEKYGFVIVIAPYQEIHTFVNREKITGLFDKSSKVIFIFRSCKLEDGSIVFPEYSDIRTTMYHEWGHFIDYAYNYLCYAPIFYQKYKKEITEYKDAIKAIEKSKKMSEKKGNLPYEYKSISEYFAVNYSRYRNKRLLREGVRIYFEALDL